MKNKIKSFLIFSSIVLSSIAHSAETISIVWGFSIGSNQAITLRHIVEEANTNQKKYNFIVESKSGAGGSIAANYVLQNPSNALVGMSSSFFIRPAVEPVESHDLDKFKPILVQGTGAPLVIVSKKYKNINELLKQENISLGISGVGSISDMLANTLKQKNPTLNIIPYKGMVDATMAVAGGHVDAAVTFLIDAKSFIDSKELTVIGYTGSKEFTEFKGLLLTQQGIRGVDKLVANYAIFVSKDMPEEKYIEIHKILNNASKNKKVESAYAKDMITISNIPLSSSVEWYDSERQYWKEMADKLPKK